MASSLTGDRRSGSGDVGETRAAARWLVVALFASIFLQRFAVPGSGGIALSLFVTLAAVAAMAVRGYLLVDPVRYACLLSFGCCTLLSVAANAERASINSVVLVALHYTPFIFSLRTHDGVLPICICMFQKMVLFCSLLGTLQYAAQFFYTGPGLFSFNGLVPADLLVPNFNTVIPLHWGSWIYKCNGFFFLEPSTFSQYLCLAILFEVIFFGTTLRLFAYAIPLLLTYSGTGPLLLMILLPCLILYRRAYELMVGLVVFGSLAVATGNLWHMDAILQRSGEFGAEGSSATARFIAGAWLIADSMHWSAHDLLFGLGPGTFRLFGNFVGYEAHDAVWAKLLLEYGTLGCLAFVAVFGRAVVHRAPSPWVAAALVLGFLTFGGMFLDPRLNTLILVFCVLPKRKAGIAPDSYRLARAASFGRTRHEVLALASLMRQE